MDEDAIHRILRKAGIDVPIDIDGRALAGDLTSALEMRATISEVGDHALRRHREEHRDRVTQASKRLLNLLKDRDHGEWFAFQIGFGSRSGSRGPAIDTFARKRLMDDLARLIEIGKDMEKASKPDHDDIEFEFSQHSQFENLVGYDLAKLYSDHFKRVPGASLSRTGKPGPYIRFVLAVLDEAGVKKSTCEPYKPLSVVAAWRKTHKRG